MKENNSFEGSPLMNSHEMNRNGARENRISTQEENNEQIKGFIAPPTRQLEV